MSIVTVVIQNSPYHTTGHVLRQSQTVPESKVDREKLLAELIECGVAAW